MTYKEFFLQIIQLLRRKFHNRVTWILVISGITLIAPPVWSVLLNTFLEQNTNYQIFGEYDEWIGVFLIILALGYNLLSQKIANYEPPKNVVKKADNSTVNQAQGNINITNIHIHNPDKETLKQILDTIDYSNTKNDVNFITSSNFELKFTNLFESLPWTINLDRKSIKSKFNLSYKTSSGKEGQFWIRPHFVDKQNKSLTLGDSESAFENKKPVLEAIYWSKLKIWTLNSIENFSQNLISIEKAMMNDLLVIVGDISFIVSDLKLELIYDKFLAEHGWPGHNDYGNLVKANLLSGDKKMKLELYEMVIIDAFVDTKIIKEVQQGDQTIVEEINIGTHIIKLSSLMIRVLHKHDRDTDDKSTETLRRGIIEFMKKINAIQSYQIPMEITSISDFLFEEAFNKSSVIDSYNKAKRDKKKSKNE